MSTGLLLLAITLLAAPVLVILIHSAVIHARDSKAALELEDLGRQIEASRKRHFGKSL